MSGNGGIAVAGCGELGLPNEGMGAADVMEALRAYKAADPEFMKTIMSIGINYGGGDIHELLNQSHALFSHENNMVVFARPGSQRMEDELLRMCARLLSGGEDGVVATISSGGTESIFNAIHASRERARRLRPDMGRPNWVAAYSAHGSLTKACHYLDIDLVRVPDRDYRADVEAMAEAVDENTIGVYASAPSFPFGLYDDIPALGRLASDNDLWLHVDACLGGFLAPFAAKLGFPVPPWDFSVPGVTSISADIHKYAYGMKPASVVAWRDETVLQDHYVYVSDWPMGEYVTPGFVGSRSGGPIAAAWAVMHFLGEQGFLERTREMLRLREELLRGLASIDGIVLPIAEPGPCIIDYAGEDVSVDQIVSGMDELGWVHFHVTEPPLVQFVLDPTVGQILDRYLADLDSVVKRARRGEIEDQEMAKTY